MTDPGDREALQKLESRLAAVRQRQAGERKRRQRPIDSAGMGAGLRVAVDLVSGLAVGVAIGIVLDVWLGTSPWMLILFFFLGSGAALTNVIRTARQLEAERKRRKEEEAGRG
ncbi:MAG: AtpZ/AtpI family protein [Pseudomonadota bacterium]